MPKLLARAIGIEPSATTSIVMRLMGAREIASGLGVLLAPRSPTPLWSRVVGDAVDLALLGLGAARRTSGLKLAGAIAAVGGVTALDVIASVKAQKAHVRANRPVIFSVTINKSPQDVYAYFRDFSRLPEFMDYLAEVREIDSKRSHWIAKPLGGRTIAWDAEIVEDIPGEVIAWQSAPKSMIKTRGRVTFAKTPGNGKGTEVRVEMQIGMRGFGASASIAQMFAKPQIKGDLRRFKQVMETGEVLLSDATVTRRPHSSQPSTPEVIEANARHETPVFVPSPPTAKKGLEGTSVTQNGAKS